MEHLMCRARPARASWSIGSTVTSPGPRRPGARRLFAGACGGIAALVAALALVDAAETQVSCADPDNLCTGDPCVITGPADVEPSCVVDFGARVLVLAGPINVPSGGVLSFTAATISGAGRIDARHLDAGTGVGGDVTLTAAGDISLAGRIDVAGSQAAGSITLDAGGNVVLGDRLDAKAGGNGATSDGGTITVDAAGTLTLDQRAFVDVRGARSQTAGGAALLRGALGVSVTGKAVVEASGADGGQIDLESGAGPVTLARGLKARGDGGAGGAVTITAAGTITVDKPLSVRGRDGGTIALASTGADVQGNQRLDARGLAGFGGTIDVSAPGTIALAKDLDARGRLLGGTILLSGSMVALPRRLRADSSAGSGGFVSVTTSGPLTMDRADIETDGVLFGGDVAVAAADLTLTRRAQITAFGKTLAGGTIDLDAAGAATVSADLDADGFFTGGHITIDAASVTVDDQADLNANGSGGEIRLHASGAGLMLLDGDFNARQGAGVIEGLTPAGSLTASGRFRAAPGCIGLSAGDTLITSGTFDEVITPSCP